MTILSIIKKVRRLIGREFFGRSTAFYWIKKDESSQLVKFSKEFSIENSINSFVDTIEHQAALTNELGELPLWKGFEELKNYPFPVKNATRRASQVRIDKQMGSLIFNVVLFKRPEVIVEIGTAFGVSGMYWLSGLENTKEGFLYTFEPNSVWASIAESNLRSISDRFKLINGTFEEDSDQLFEVSKKIDVAFIDAIHVGEIVQNQFRMLTKFTSPNAWILFDDINFSEDMTNCWETIAKGNNVKSSFSLLDRIGVVELK